ncbi:MAG: thiaminase II [Solirubrobacteraceae bacterium]
MGLSAELRAAADPIWRAQRSHPFLRGIEDGTLAPERFAFYMRQDYRFLIDYARALALGAARAPELRTMTRFAELAREVLVTEMALHRSFAASLGITEDELQVERAAPATQGYADFLVRTAAQGDFGELVVALAPCMWGYAELGQGIAARGRPPVEHYARWVDMYASPEFGELADWCRGLVDHVGERLSDGGRAPLESAFQTSSCHELAFWEMAWRGGGRAR